MIQNTSPHDTEPSMPRVATLTPPPLPESEQPIEVTDADLVVFDTTVPVIAKGHARVTLAGALLDAHHSIRALEDIANALLRATGANADDVFYLSGCCELAREGIRRVSASTITAARALDAEVVKP